MQLRLLAQFPQMTVAHQPLVLFIPQPVSGRFKAAEQRDGLHLLKQRVGLMAFLQIVVKGARADSGDGCGWKPMLPENRLQDMGQLVEGTAFQRRRDVAPVLAAFLAIDTFKLVLHVKHPNALHATGDTSSENDHLDRARKTRCRKPGSNIPPWPAWPHSWHVPNGVPACWPWTTETVAGWQTRTAVR